MNKKLLVFQQLQVAHTALFRAADQRTRAELGLTSSQLAVLFTLHREDGQPISKIANELAMGKSSLTGLIDRMCDRGFVRRSTSVLDGRVTNVYLEPPGQRAVEFGILETKRFNRELLAPFSLEEQDTIQRFLQHLSENADGIINRS